MKFKKILCAAVAATLTLSVSGAIVSGCYSTNNEEDVKQVVATVNCSASIKKEFGDEYGSVIGDAEVLKRDLIASFMNVGSTYVSSYGMSYEQTFEIIVNGLVENAVVTQYAIASLLKKGIAEGTVTLAAYTAKTTEEEKLTYLLGSEKAAKAEYEFYSSINSSLDAYEKRNLAEENGYVGSGSRATPSGIDSLKDDYVPAKYGIYTGYQGYLLSDAGDEYEALEGSTKSTRRRAYAQFIANLKQNYLISNADVDTTDIMSIGYIKSVYVSKLKEAIVDSYNEVFEDEQEAIVTQKDANGEFTYVKQKYEGLDGEYTRQEKKYSNTSDFESSLGSISETSFILYSPSTQEDSKQVEVEGQSTYGTYGYVYNILLPFSKVQSVKLTELQKYRDASPQIIDDSKYFYERNQLLKQITTTDQRSSWFNGSTDYSFDASEAGLEVYDGGLNFRKYLFFENNLTKGGENGKYEALDKYIGQYTYNGKVVKNNNGSYSLLPVKLTIDSMLSEFSAYINYVLGASTNAAVVHAGDTLSGGTAEADFNAYYEITDFTKAGDDTEIDYSKLVYATGKVDFGTTEKLGDKDMFVKDSARYKVMSAVNELQYAYTTDTAVLSQYIGYSVSAYSTSFIKEFEYAAQQALRMGVGAFKVCAGDYGWHLIYVTDTFSTAGGAAYGELKWNEERIYNSGDTFEKQFFEWIKDKAISTEVSKKRSEILKDYNKDENVTIDKKTYKDLTELDK